MYKKDKLALSIWVNPSDFLKKNFHMLFIYIFWYKLFIKIDSLNILKCQIYIFNVLSIW